MRTWRGKERRAFSGYKLTQGGKGDGAKPYTPKKKEGSLSSLKKKQRVSISGQEGQKFLSCGGKVKKRI